MVPRSRQSNILQNSFSCLAAATLVYAFREICAFKRYHHCASALIHQLSDCFEWCLRAKRIPTNGMRLKSFNPKTVFHRTDKVLVTFCRSASHTHKYGFRHSIVSSAFSCRYPTAPPDCHKLWMVRLQPRAGPGLVK